MKKFIIKSAIFSMIFFGFGVIALLLVKARGSVPNDLQSSPGDKMTSTKRNQLVGNVVKTNAGKSMTSNGLYCGLSVGSYDGAGVGGYAGAKTKCETACSDQNAHMCDAHEIYMSKTLGITVNIGSRYSTYTRSRMGGSVNKPMSDCQQWTNNTTSYVGRYIDPAGQGAPARDYCNASHPIACCK